MSVIKKLASETAIYGLSSIAGRMVYYLLVKLHTDVFLPSEMAISINIFSWVGILNVLYTFGMETTYLRFANLDKPNSKRVFNQIQTLVLAVNLSFTILFLLFLGPIASFLKPTATQVPYASTFVIWMLAVLLLDGITQIPFARLRLENQAKRFALTRFVNIMVNVLFNLIFLWLLRQVALGNILESWQPFAQKFYNSGIAIGFIFLANLIANGVTLFMLRDVLADFKPEFSKAQALSFWKYAAPLLLMGLAGNANQLFDRLTLMSFLPEGFYPGLTDQDALGIYGNCIKLAIFMNLAVQAFRYAADPFFFSKATDKNAPELQARVMKWFVIATVAMWVAISFNLPILKEYFLTKKIYHQGIAVVPIVLAANLLLGVYYNQSMWFKLTNKTQYGLYFTLLGFGVNLIFSVILVPQIGYMGSAWAYLASMVVVCIGTYNVGQKHYPVPYNLVTILSYLAIGAFLNYFSYKIVWSNFWLDFVLKNLILVLLLGIVYIYELKILKNK